MENPKFSGRLFVGLMPAGIVYADRGREEHGDYKRIAFLSYHNLEFKAAKLSDASEADRELLRLARGHAETIQAQRGQKLQISTAGQGVTLGWGMPA